MKALLVLAVTLCFATEAISQNTPKWVRTNHGGGISAITLTGDSKYLISTSARNDEIIVWSGQTGAFLRRANLGVLRQPYDQLLEINTSAALTGTQLIVLGTDSGIYIYDADRMEITERITGPETRDTRYIAVSSSNDTLLWVTYWGGAYRYSREKKEIIDQLTFERGPQQLFEPYERNRLAVSRDLGILAFNDYFDLFIANFEIDTTFKLYDKRFGDLQSISDDNSMLIMNDRFGVHRDALRLLDLQFIDTFMQGLGALTSQLEARDGSHSFYVTSYMSAPVKGASYSDVFLVKGSDTTQVTGLNAEIAVSPVMPLISVGGWQGSTSYSTNGVPLRGPVLPGWNYGGQRGINYAPTGELCGHSLGGDEMIEGYLFVGKWTAINHIPTWGVCYNAPKLDPIAPRVAVGLDIIRIDTTYVNYQGPCPLVTAEWTRTGSHYLWSAYNDSLVFQDRNNEQRSVETGHRKILDIAVSQRNDLIATAGSDSTVKLWNIDGQLIKTFMGHTGKVNEVNFAPNGKQLVSASSDSTIRVWDIEKGEIFKYDSFREPFYQAAVSNDGLTVIGATDRSIVGFDAASWASVKQTNVAKQRTLAVRREANGVTLENCFDADKRVQLEVYDILGRLLLREEHSGKQAISINTESFGKQPLLVTLSQNGEVASALVP